jgi:uncharacterized repeat protein (TIGR03803 family)
MKPAFSRGRTRRSRFSFVLSKDRTGVTAVLALAVMLASPAQARSQTFTVLTSFQAGGFEPNSTLVRDQEGNLYGTAYYGGNVSGICGGSCGTIFRIDKHGKQTALHKFSGPDGNYAPARLLRDGRGNLFGTTVQGGAFGFGTVFMLDALGNEKLLYSFKGGTDGFQPLGGLVTDGRGHLYGTTASGGNSSCGNGCGTIFKVDRDGNETVLYRFTGGKDGAFPSGRIVLDGAGNLYGIVQAGESGCTKGCVYKLDPAGELTVLHAFTGSPDGANPVGGLIRDGSGNLYGTTAVGGDSPACTSGCGTVFMVDAAGNETVLHAFNDSDGSIPYATVIRDKAGNLYGTTLSGGGISCKPSATECGVVFRLDASGNETVLHRFHGSDGFYPMAGLILTAAGDLFGVTEFGGNAGGGGVAFKIHL